MIGSRPASLNINDSVRTQHHSIIVWLLYSVVLILTILDIIHSCTHWKTYQMSYNYASGVTINCQSTTSMYSTHTCTKSTVPVLCMLDHLLPTFIEFLDLFLVTGRGWGVIDLSNALLGSCQLAILKCLLHIRTSKECDTEKYFNPLNCYK